MASPFTYLELHSSDPKKARRFYTELLGWKTKPAEVPGRDYHEIDAGEGLPGGLTDAFIEGVGGWLVYVRVDDAQASTRRARELGAQVLRDCVQIPEGVFSVVRDPAGSAVGLFQPAKR